MCAHIKSTDSWEYISSSEEVEVHPALSFGSGVWRARESEDQHGLCWDQTGASPTEDGSHADCGALCFRPVLPANQRAECHEKVNISAASIIKAIQK